MIIFTESWYSIELVEDHDPYSIFVFGDNSAGWGTGGQAVIRNCPNTLGIPTKWSPHHYYSDDCHDVRLIEKRLSRLGRLLADGQRVVLPGTYDKIAIGDGLAELPTRAPVLYADLQRRLRGFADTFGFMKESF